jgi:hypothetical protein
MRILVDENVPSITVRELRVMGHDVVAILGQALGQSMLSKFAQKGILKL